MYARHLGNLTHPCMGKNTVAICMNNWNELHLQQPSITDLSFAVTLTQDAAALILKRTKNMKLADKDC